MNFKPIKKKELLRFLIGGGSAVLVDFAAYRLLMYAGVGRELSKAISYVLGAAVGFIINKCWTFESKGFSPWEIIRYILLYAFSAGVNTLVNKLVLIAIPAEMFAFLCATSVSTVLNFIGQKCFVFRK